VIVRARARLLGPAAAIALLALASPAAADVFAPSLLVLEAEPEGAVAVTWRRPVVANRVAGMTPLFPTVCTRRGEARAETDGRALTERWHLDCGATGLAGATLRVDGLQSGEVVVRLTHTAAEASGEPPAPPLTAVLGPDSPSLTIPADAERTGLLATYTALGFEHILGGADHLLFVLGLLLLISSRRRLLLSVTAFTAGHSVTLALASLGVFPRAGPAVEALIALSVVLLASEAAAARPVRTLTARRPELIAAGFGLLHGLGFAGALAEIGLPRDGLWTALGAFNVGVEFGQLAFIAVALTAGGLAATLARRLRLDIEAARRLVALPAGVIATVWLLERVVPLVVFGAGA
jgi:hydrogenase/urease accessory protein HupE